MRVVFVNRFFRPDESATSQLCSELAGQLSSAGVPVAVITSRMRHDDADARLPAREVLQGIDVHRVWTTRFGRAGIAGRALDYLSFYVMATLRMMQLVRKDAVLVAMTDPPLISVPAACVARCRRAPLVNWLQDFFPEVAQRLGVLNNRRLHAMLRNMRDWSLRVASRNVAIGDHMGAMVGAAAPGRTEVIPNWALEEGDPVDATHLRDQWGLQGRFVVGYSGNLGRAHRLDVVIDAAAQLRGDPRVAFLLVGDGAQRALLQRRARDLQLDNVVFQPFQPRERLRETLSLPDIHLVSLDARLEGLIVPSKFVGVIALGKPVIWLGEPRGELGSIVEASGCGIAVTADDPAALAAHIAALARDAQRIATMRARATALWAGKYQRQRALDSWRHLLRDPR